MEQFSAAVAPRRIVPSDILVIKTKIKKKRKSLVFVLHEPDQNFSVE